MDYRATLNLPQTSFKMKANLAQKEPEFLKRWEAEDLYGRVQAASAGRPEYILHDGPPYANGHIHLGTAFNKVLKDIILKSKRMAGYHCPYVPGWDCHGLPIEHNVDKELGAKKKEISKLAFRGACRNYANKWIKTQKAEFKRLGVFGAWDDPYLTINFGYEASIAREFNRFLINGSVVRAKKPVYWCSSCRTALAEAEVEYENHASPSIYVKFKFNHDLGAAIPALAGKDVFAVIWTTTPWTLPANLAVALHPDFTYAAVQVGAEVWLIAEGLLEGVFAELGLAHELLATFSAGAIEGQSCRHPFLDRDSQLILAPYVTLEAGTGCVHTAPGHGREDYLSGIKYNLEILSPVDAQGLLTAEAGPYAGMFIFDANRVINEDLAKSGALIQQSSLSHSYPHCWRCKKPVFFRATEQWFISMENNELRTKALAAIDEVSWVPSWGRERIRGMVVARPDWCLSRQRAWGVPLTVFYCKQCGTVRNDEEVAARIVALFEQEGADAWFKHPDEAFLGPNAKCLKCGAQEFDKEEDILDVWFDSGVSYAAVLEGRPELRAPADLYLEGSDQHRGWFQSALLAAIGTRGQAPYRKVLTHGFVVDGKGKKMSKSIGNVIAPEEIIKEYGAEILRLWVSSEDYRDDIKISDEILKQLSDAYRKIRNTIRYMLSNINDFDPATDKVEYAAMDGLDQWALRQFELLKKKVMAAYEEFEFHGAFHGLHQFCGVTMSSFYLDVLKDRLYTSGANSPARKSAQTVLYEILDGLLRLMAPVMSFTAAEAWEFLPADASRPGEVFLAKFPPLRAGIADPQLDAVWLQLMEVRAEITKALEIARRDKVIGHPLEAEVLVVVAGNWAALLGDHWPTLKTISIVSQLERVESVSGECFASELMPGLQVQVRAAAGQKCDRCWTRSATVGESVAHPLLCDRCLEVVVGMDLAALS